MAGIAQNRFALEVTVLRPGDPLSPVAYRRVEKAVQKPPDVRPRPPLPKVPANRRYVAQARAAPPIEELAPRALAITKLGLGKDDLDARVPEPKSCRGRNLIAYSHCVYERGNPPHPQFAEFSVYEDWLLALEYRSAAWCEEHDKFCTGSMAGAILGLDKQTSPEKVWINCRFPSAVKPQHAEGLYILERGVQCETLHHQLMCAVDPAHKYVGGCGSQLHRTVKWILATPDAKVYDETGRHVRDCEFKTPWLKPAYVEVPPRYMAQLQIAMAVDQVDEDDFSTLFIIDETGYCEWVVLRVKRSKRYWKAALPVLASFCRAALSGARPPPRGTFDPPSVKTEMILRLVNPLDLLSDWRRKLSDALALAHVKAEETAAKNAEANARLSQQQLEADRAARAAVDSAFV